MAPEKKAPNWLWRELCEPRCCLEALVSSYYHPDQLQHGAFSLLKPEAWDLTGHLQRDRQFARLLLKFCLHFPNTLSWLHQMDEKKKSKGLQETFHLAGRLQTMKMVKWVSSFHWVFLYTHTQLLELHVHTELKFLEFDFFFFFFFRNTLSKWGCWHLC